MPDRRPPLEVIRFHLSRGITAADYLLEEPRELPVYAEHLHTIWYAGQRIEKMTRHIESTVVHRLAGRGFSRAEIMRLTHMTDHTYNKRMALGTHLQDEGKWAGYWQD